MAVIIRKKRAVDGVTYEIENFADYISELRNIGMDVPKAKYRIFISAPTARDIALTGADIESQVALFFRIGPSSGIECEFR